MSEVTQVEFAKMCGVSAPAIHKACRSKGRSKVVLNRSGYIDTDNKYNKAYLERHLGVKKLQLDADVITAAVSQELPPHNSCVEPERKPMGVGAKPAAKAPSAKPDAPRNISASDLLNMTLREIVSNFSSVEGAITYVKMLGDLTRYNKEELTLSVKRGELIRRDFVEAHVFKYLENLSNQLLDVPEAIAEQIGALFLSEGEGAKPKVARLIAEKFENCIKTAKTSIVHDLDEMQAKDTDDKQERLEELEREIEGMKDETD